MPETDLTLFKKDLNQLQYQFEPRSSSVLELSLEKLPQTSHWTKIACELEILLYQIGIAKNLKNFSNNTNYQNIFDIVANTNNTPQGSNVIASLQDICISYLSIDFKGRNQIAESLKYAGVISRADKNPIESLDALAISFSLFDDKGKEKLKALLVDPLTGNPNVNARCAIFDICSRYFAENKFFSSEEIASLEDLRV
jgi:hypothetical protein